MGKKILVVGHAYIVPVNRYIWSRFAKDYNKEVTIIVPHHWKSNLLGEVKFQRVSADERYKSINPIEVYNKGNGSTYYYNLIETWKVLKKEKFDLIIINQENWALSLFFFNLCRVFTQNLKTKTFLMIAQNLKKKHLRKYIILEKFNLIFVDLLLGCCQETFDVIKWKNIKTSWKYFPLFHTSTIQSCNKTIPNIEALKLGYIGRLSTDKGIETLIDFFKNSKQSDELIVAGDGPLKEEITSIATNYLGLVSHSEVNDFYKEIDLLVVPSLTMPHWKEQFGRVLVEAVAAGKMVIGSNSGAIPEVLGAMKIDYIFNEGDAESLGCVLQRVREDIVSGSFEQKRLEAMRLCEKQFSEKAFLDRLEGYSHEA